MIFIDFELIYYQFSVIFSQFSVRGSTGFDVIFSEFYLNFGSILARFSFKMLWFYYQISLKIGFENQRNISLQFWDFIIKFSLIGPCYSNFIFVSLLVGNWQISWPLKGLTAFKFLYHFVKILSKNWLRFDLNFHEISLILSSILVEISLILSEVIINLSWFSLNFNQGVVQELSSILIRFHWKIADFELKLARIWL